MTERAAGGTDALMKPKNYVAIAICLHGLLLLVFFATAVGAGAPKLAAGVLMLLITGLNASAVLKAHDAS